MFALSTALRDFGAIESPPSGERFAREILDLGAGGAVAAAGLSEVRFRDVVSQLTAGACPVLAVDAPGPMLPEYDRHPERFSALTPSAIDPDARRAFERAAHHTLELAAEASARFLTLRLGAVVLPPGISPSAVLLDGERLGSPRAAAYVRDALDHRSRVARPHFDAARRVIDSLVPRAESLGVGIAIVMPRSLEELPSFRELDAILLALAGAPLGIWLDPAGAFFLDAIGLKPARAWVDQFRASIRGLSFRDARKTGDEIELDLRPGEGAIDFRSLRESLGEAAGAVLATYDLPDADAGLAREAMSGLRRQGWFE